MKTFIFAAVISVVTAGAAFANDFIVVSSTDPLIKKSATFSAGARVNIATGSTVTVVNGAGAVTVLRAQPGGVVLPRASQAANPDRMASLSSFLSRPETRSTFGAMRGGRYGDESCPKAEELVTLEQILAAEEDDCSTVADTAMQAFIARGGETPAPEAAPAQ